MLTYDEELRQKLSLLIAPYVAESAVPIVIDWIIEYKIHVTLTPQRSSKYGDYRHPYRNKGHRISINKNLNRHSFLITFIHEIAHLKCWMMYRNQVPAHGKVWKAIFAELIHSFMSLSVFPDEILKALYEYAKAPGSSTCSDEYLMRILAKYDRVQRPRVEELAEGALFHTINGRLFRKGNVIRKRIQCEEVQTHKVYLFHPFAEVIPYQTDLQLLESARQ